MSLNIPGKTILKVISPALYTMATTIEGWANGLQWNPITLPAGMFSIGDTLGQNPPLFCLDPFGFVHLRGLITTLTNSTPLSFANVPSTMAPNSDMYVSINENLAVGGEWLPFTLLIDTGGTLTQTGIFSNAIGDQFSFDGIVYPIF